MGLRRSGFSLITVLGLLGVVLVLALAISAGTVGQLQLTNTMAHRARARHHAESAIARAIQQLMAEPSYGMADSPGEVLGDAQLTFNSELATELGLPLSFNNLGSDSPSQGNNRVVPPESAQLLAVGRSGPVSCVVEVLLTLGDPDVISSSGPVATEGGVVVARVTDASELGDLESLEPEDLDPGTMASNSAENKAIELSQETIITGDVKAVGGIEVTPGAQILGRVMPGARASAIPDVDISSYDPVAQGRPEVQTLQGGRISGETLSGFYVHRGDLTVDDGLELGNAVLYVDGNLTVHGGVSGRGAMISTGSTRVEDGVALSSDNQVALLSQGDVTLQGFGKASTFSGLVYTEGDFSAEQVTVVGTFVANSPEGSEVTFKDANLIQNPRSQEVRIATRSGSSATLAPAQLVAGEFRRSPIAREPLIDLAGTADYMNGLPDGWSEVDFPNIRLSRMKLEVEKPQFNWRLTTEDGEVLLGEAAFPDPSESYYDPFELHYATPINEDDSGATGGGTPVLELGEIQPPGVRFYQGEELRYSLVGMPFRPQSSAEDQGAQEVIESVWKIDLNEFLGPRERMRLIYWQQR